MQRTEYELLSGRKHIYAKSDLNLVLLQREPTAEALEDGLVLGFLGSVLHCRNFLFRDSFRFFSSLIPSLWSSSATPLVRSLEVDANCMANWDGLVGDQAVGEIDTEQNVYVDRYDSNRHAMAVCRISGTFNN